MSHEDRQRDAKRLFNNHADRIGGPDAVGVADLLNMLTAADGATRLLYSLLYFIKVNHPNLVPLLKQAIELFEPMYQSGNAVEKERGFMLASLEPADMKEIA